MSFRVALCAMALLAQLLVICSGCASTDPYGEATVPWGTPQPWESAPVIPGLERQ